MHRTESHDEDALGMMAGTSDGDGDGDGAKIRFAGGECALGSILVATSGQGVCAILLGDSPERLVEELESRFPRAALLSSEGGLANLMASIVAFVEKPATGLDLPPEQPLHLRGTAFQQRVWQALQQIPAGATTTYTELAAAIGQPRAVRAVAQACAANALAVAVPCHRVVRRDGELAGYRWGVERKRRLLAIEAEG